MENNTGNDSMQSTSVLCRAGCGFYGSATFEDMCSKCYKDAVKRRQDSIPGRTSPTISATAYGNNIVVSNTSSNKSSSSSSSSLKTATPTVTVSSSASTTTTSTVESKASEKKSECVAAIEEKAEVAVANSSKDKEEEKEGKKPKKNRCHVCKKKVGLTGFECRCNGLFCSIHRYSDKHDCTFNYKEMAQVQIRKNNPVIVGAKIQKI